MKKLLFIFFSLFVAVHINAQKQRTSQDSIKVFYGALFTNLKEGYLFKDTVNWHIVENETLLKLSKYTDFKKSLTEIEPLFSKIGATHCGVNYDGSRYKVSAKILKDSYSDEWKKKFASKPAFEVKIIANKYGYILMPALNFSDLKPANVNKISQQLYDQIVSVKLNNELEGWIIDLRMNTGGNSWPMLLSLYDFLGDNNIAGTIDVNKKLISTVGFSKGHYLLDGIKQYRITPKGKLVDKTRVAIITGVVTASSGEVVAMAFKGRPHTVFIGENTLGFTTANYVESLPFGAIMNLTKAYNSDRFGNYYSNITPDVIVSKQDNFEDLVKDRNIQEAIKYISKE